MKQYSAVIGVYVRTYAYFSFEAENDEAAAAAAIAKFKADDSSISFQDTDWNNTIQPAIASITDEETNTNIIEGESFTLGKQDALEYAAQDMYEALKEAEKSVSYACTALQAPQASSIRFTLEMIREVIAKAERVTQ